MVVKLRSSTASSRHTDSVKNCIGLMFDDVLERLLDRDVCGLQLRCEATWHEEHVTLWMSSTEPFHQGSLLVDRGTTSQQHQCKNLCFRTQAPSHSISSWHVLSVHQWRSLKLQEIFSCSGRSCTTRFVAPSTMSWAMMVPVMVTTVEIVRAS